MDDQMDDVAVDAASKSAMTPEQRAIRRLMARVMWSADTGKFTGDKAEMKAAYAEARAAYTAKAGKILRMMERKGATITLPVSAHEAAEEE